MKKIVVFLVISLMLFSACGNEASNNDDLVLEENNIVSNSEEERVIEEKDESEINNSNTLEVEEKSSGEEKSDIIPFEEINPAEFFLNGEIDSAGIVGKANLLGLFKFEFTEDRELVNYSWSSVEKLDVDYLLSKFGQILGEYELEDYRAQYRDYESPKNNNENPEDRIFEVYQIPQEDYEGYIRKYIDVPAEKLRSVPEYDSSAETYECLLVIHNGRGGGWPYEYETEQVSDDIYKISMIDASASPNPTLDFIITVENNNNIPKYLSVEKVV